MSSARVSSEISGWRDRGSSGHPRDQTRRGDRANIKQTGDRISSWGSRAVSTTVHADASRTSRREPARHGHVSGWLSPQRHRDGKLSSMAAPSYRERMKAARAEARAQREAEKAECRSADWSYPVEVRRHGARQRPRPGSGRAGIRVQVCSAMPSSRRWPTRRSRPWLVELRRGPGSLNGTLNIRTKPRSPVLQAARAVRNS